MYKILVVDDEKEVVAGLKKALENNDFEVITAYDGVEGLKKAFEERPSLILLDIMMPKKDGFTMLKELRMHELGRNVPVVILSVKGESHALLKSQELGSVDYIIKPYSVREVIDCVKRYL
jgi:two-component system alkaline phosphatase synthesis response regulator PhoP